MDVQPSLPVGQEEARTRWGTHTSGATFDRKKTPYLTEQAQQFIAERAFCVIAGPGSGKELCGMMAMGKPGFVQVLDAYTCLLQLDGQLKSSRILRGLRQAQADGYFARLGLFFICHTTRQRLCVQGMAELLPYRPPGLLDHSSVLHECAWVRLYVQQAFFHCAKYIRTRVAGLTSPAPMPSERTYQWHELVGHSRAYLTEPVKAFIARQVLCFICTVDQHGQCAVNHRGGAPGFLVMVSPDYAASCSIVLLPDYAGNGAFEAVGNILETGQVALVIPDYAAQLALCVSGPACVLEPGDLVPELAQRCSGAERVVAMAVQCVEAQSGDWSSTLAYERIHAESLLAANKPVAACPM
jgi:uncharacterized protein